MNSCHKKYSAIIILACVDARGKLTYIAGAAGQVGDAFMWDGCSLSSKIDNGLWLVLSPDVSAGEMTIDDFVIKPYICADSALLCLFLS